jgi:drug/metabolite transporter (DMT)-like permease
MSERAGFQGELLAFAAATAFSTKAVLVKVALADGADPIALLAVRMALAAPIFAAIAWRTSPGRPSARDVGATVALGVLGYHAAAALDFAGLAYVSAGLERVVLYVHPTLVVLFTAALARSWPSPRELAGIGVAWLGLVVAVAGDLRGGATGDIVTGVGLVLGCAFCYAGYLMGADRVGKQRGTVHTAAAATAVSALTLGAQVALTRADRVAAMSWSSIGIAAVIAVVSTVLPVTLLAWAIVRIGPSRASALGMVGPTMAAVLGWLVLGEPLTLLNLIGGAIVVVGVAVARRAAGGESALSAEHLANATNHVAPGGFRREGE